MKKHIFSYGAGIIFMLMLCACGNSPVTICDSNPHYFSYKDKPVVLISSDHHYGAVVDKDFDFAKYLEYLSDNGMNVTRIYPGGMFETPDKYLKGNPLGPLPGRQLLPWAKSDQPGANPLLAEPGQPSFKFDLDKWNPEYFDRLKAFVEFARKKEIIVEIPFFNGMYEVCWPLMAMYHENNIQNVGQYEAKECGLFTTNHKLNQDVIKYQEAYIKKITEELNAFDNLIFDICDEPSLQGLPDGGCIFLPDSTVVPWVNIMKDAFLKAEMSLPKKHLLGQTILNLSPDLSGEKWCDWLPTEYARSAEKALDLNYKFNKPLMNVESNYFGCSLVKNPYTVDAIRIEGWWYMLGGGAGCINLNGEYYRGNETGGVNTQNQIVPQKKLLINFMNSFDFAGMSGFTNFNGVPSGAIANALAEEGKQYALYLFHGSFEGEWGSHFMTDPGNYRDTIIFNAIPEGKYFMEWIDPTSGTILNSQDLNWNGGDLKLVTPPYCLDVALRMFGYK
jgi:hypothetical protein